MSSGFFWPVAIWLFVIECFEDAMHIPQEEIFIYPISFSKIMTIDLSTESAFRKYVSEHAESRQLLQAFDVRASNREYDGTGLLRKLSGTLSDGTTINYSLIGSSPNNVRLELRFSYDIAITSADAEHSWTETKESIYGINASSGKADLASVCLDNWELERHLKLTAMIGEIQREVFGRRAKRFSDKESLEKYLCSQKVSSRMLSVFKDFNPNYSFDETDGVLFGVDQKCVISIGPTNRSENGVSLFFTAPKTEGFDVFELLDSGSLCVNGDEASGGPLYQTLRYLVDVTSERLFLQDPSQD